jgi:DNA-binding MarR family transcriptional regulator
VSDLDSVWIGDGDPFAGLGKLPRADGQFARVPLSWLTNRQWDVLFTSAARLYLYLLAKSFGGNKPVRVTGEMVDALGLDRRNKSRLLRRLERAGLVAVEQTARRLPVVTILGL